MKSVRTKKISTSGIAFTGHCLFAGLIVGTDGANDPTVTVYDGTDNTGTEVFPTNTYDASVKRLDSETFPIPIECRTGIYVEISIGGGSCEVIILYKERENWGIA